MKKCISVGIQHQIIKFEENKKTPTTYQAIPENILLRARYPKFVHSAKVLYGDVAELIVENVLMNGAQTLSHLVAKVTERIASDVEQANIKHDENIVYQKCEDLVKGHYLKRLKLSNDIEKEAAEGSEKEGNDEEKLYEIPAGILQGIK